MPLCSRRHELETRDLIVIGGGPAGYVAAIRAAQLGARVAIVERDTPGGTCVSRGCIPVRALVRAAELVDLGKMARDYGVNYGPATVDFARTMSRKDTVVRTAASGVRLLLESNGVEIIKGEATLQSPSEVEVVSDAGGLSLTARSVVIASGSKPHVHPQEWVGRQVISPSEALLIKEVPAVMTIVGGGFVGLAFATIFSRFGTRVTVVEQSGRLLPQIDAEVVSVLEKELRKNNVTFVLGRGAPSPLSSEAGQVLIAESRVPDTEGLGLGKVGVRLNAHGGVAVDGGMRTSVAGLFAAGDVIADSARGGWTHISYAQGLVAAENALGKRSSLDLGVIPLCANTIPEVAGVGMTEEGAIAGGLEVRVGRFPYAANSTATVLGQRTGLLKIISERKYGQILGAHAVGVQASTLIPEIALAMKLEATVQDLASMIHCHPTLSEIVWEAARDVFGETIHMVSSNKRS